MRTAENQLSNQSDNRCAVSIPWRWLQSTWLRLSRSYVVWSDASAEGSGPPWSWSWADIHILLSPFVFSTIFRTSHTLKNFNFWDFIMLSVYSVLPSSTHHLPFLYTTGQRLPLVTYPYTTHTHINSSTNLDDILRRDFRQFPRPLQWWKEMAVS